ncbi:hypothetical protein [Microcella sp.]|uniref:hypothetical protein n=1 Tax=Microcella sp. TaxID=1913979 RepID=UPI00255F085E|nr:hypothetical protein [Microcella sp.]MBX9471700.1 hypothetical protein [Microcella sp.]
MTTTRNRPWLALALLTVLPVLAACSADSTEAPESPDTIESSDEAASPPAAVELPCGAADAAELEAVFGAGLGDGRIGTVNVTENEVTWNADSCTWEAESVEVQLRISDADDFAAGFACLEPLAIGSDLEVVAGLSDQAWWQFSGSSGAEGELRLCTGDTLVEVLIEAESGDSAVLRDQAVELAELVISKL